MKRFFLVGCARSGTTLLQSLLASHPDIISFPESNFFNHLFPHSEPKRNRLGLISRRAKPRLAEFLQESGYSGHRPSPLALFPSQLTAHFSKTLDQLAAQQNKKIWIEKTPTHIYHLDYISQHISQPRFIHIIRAGKDAVASLYDVRQKYPKQWANEPASIELSIDRWLKDVSLSLQYVNSPHHHLVSYEALVANPQPTLERLCQFMDVHFTPTMLNSYASTAQQVSLAREPWKAGVASPIRSANSTKFYSLFDGQQQEYILRRTAAIDLSRLKPYPIC
ncbi:MAG: sulfotransferase [Phormidesmis sp. RL_2_1]|nr:sulfotransferase [Phormidesmis sp. RL_2_1]